MKLDFLKLTINLNEYATSINLQKRAQQSCIICKLRKFVISQDNKALFPSALKNRLGSNDGDIPKRLLDNFAIQ